MKNFPVGQGSRSNVSSDLGLECTFRWEVQALLINRLITVVGAHVLQDLIDGVLHHEAVDHQAIGNDGIATFEFQILKDVCAGVKNLEIPLPGVTLLHSSVKQPVSN